MRLEPVPVLQVLRDLWTLPRDMARFHAYLEKVKQGPEGEVFVPLIAANPMAREHMVAFVDALRALGADRILADACAEASKRLAASDLALKLSLVPIDDVGGAWSERTLVDFDNRFGMRKAKAGWAKYGFVTANVYVSEPPTPVLVRERLLAAAYRAAWTHRHGQAQTLRDMMQQEGNALRFAGAQGPSVPELDRVRATLASHLDATLHATRFAAMYGDEAAKRCGHAPLGLPDDAGFAAALADALRGPTRPEELRKPA